MKKFYFYGTVIYPVKNENDVPNGCLGLHMIQGENEEETRKGVEDAHNKQNLHLVDVFGKTTKARFKWFGEYKNE